MTVSKHAFINYVFLDLLLVLKEISLRNDEYKQFLPKHQTCVSDNRPVELSAVPL